MLPAFQICAFSRREAYRPRHRTDLYLAVEAQIPGFQARAGAGLPPAEGARPHGRSEDPCRMPPA